VNELFAGDSDAKQVEVKYFQSRIGQSFPAGKTRLVLRECQAQALPRHDARPKEMRQPFSLLFEIADRGTLDSSQMTIDHPQLGQVTVAITQTYGPDQGTHYAEAVFS
tara:strand:+ start:226037 stop:226360 length:324 start_codon:yes stop_codon:yes gene_type:complete